MQASDIDFDDGLSMNSPETEFPVLAFVDIETTGGNPDRDRITEIGIKTLAQGQVRVWESLLDPQTFIPHNIQRLTGITSDMVAGQPTFDELAVQLKQVLEGKIFVAHNARFDHGFIKASFKRLGMDFRPKVLCTVKLSRLLFPNQARHNLDTIVAVHGLTVGARHRALGDADLLVQFWQVCEKTFGQARLLEAVNQLVGRVSLPPNITPSVIDAIPDTTGCYIFYGEHHAPLYIGKSISMRTRVMSHFQSALSVRKEMKLSQQVHHIEWMETSGELSALILESRLIKARMPSMNVKLRKSKDLCAWQLRQEASGLLRPTLITHTHLQPGAQDHLYGLFYNKKEALAYLAAVAKKHSLCEALLGLEKVDEGKSCFGYQVKQCQGACVGKVSLTVHNLKLQTALQPFKVPVWPYEGAVAIKDGHSLLVINQWCYLGTANDHNELHGIAQSKDFDFDLDIYKIVKKAMTGSHKSSVIKIG
jgi:DNA polymerase-3 subunit epsilon